MADGGHGEKWVGRVTLGKGEREGPTTTTCWGGARNASMTFGETFLPWK